MKKFKKELMLVLALLFLDQVTKYIIRMKFFPCETHVVLPFFQLTYVTNTGISFGLFQGGNAVFTVLTALVLAGFIFWYVRNKPKLTAWLRWSVILIVSGASGNLIDRIFHGRVIDFLEFHIGTHYWPAFNVADSCISVGGVILFLSVLKSEFFKKAK
ncbi:MAG: signal peptidase II [Elusimicrobiota bacterium]